MALDVVAAPGQRLDAPGLVPFTRIFRPFRFRRPDAGEGTDSSLGRVIKAQTSMRILAFGFHGLIMTEKPHALRIHCSGVGSEFVL